MCTNYRWFCFWVCITVVFFAACSSDGIHNFNKNMEKISHGVKTFDSATVKLSKGATEFSEHAEKYVDTGAYKKDSSGVWDKK